MLATLQEMILAARADGDTDTADWLASIADDPQMLARVTSVERQESEHERTEGDWRWLLEHGFTGTDSHNHKWVDGKQVATDHDPAAGGVSANAHTPDEAKIERKAKSLAVRIKDVPKAVAAKVGSWVQAKYEKLTARYGKTGARAIMGAMILLAPMPAPGSSLIPIALAEAVLRVRRAVRGARAESSEPDGAGLTAEQVNAIARHLLADLEDEVGADQT